MRTIKPFVSARTKLGQDVCNLEPICRVAKFSWYMIPKAEKMYQMNTKCHEASGCSSVGGGLLAG
jgi:hypothetical protein